MRPTYLMELQRINEQMKAINIHIITEIGSLKDPLAAPKALLSMAW